MYIYGSIFIQYLMGGPLENKCISRTLQHLVPQRQEMPLHGVVLSSLDNGAQLCAQAHRAGNAHKKGICTH